MYFSQKFDMPQFIFGLLDFSAIINYCKVSKRSKDHSEREAHAAIKKIDSLQKGS